jgi:hypothetical protein
MVSPGCSVELTDHETGCSVVLLGCFHGSRSSAADVKDALLFSSTNNETTDVVVLELCAKRFADLRRDFEKAAVVSDFTFDGSCGRISVASDEEGDESAPAATSSVRTTTPWIARYIKMIRKTAMEQGWPAAAAAALLGGVSGLQTAVSSLQPGLEFTTALSIAVEKEMDVVLADQNVDTTLSNMGNLPSVSFDMWKDLLTTGSWEETFGKEASALKIALLGDDAFAVGRYKSLPSQVTLPAFLTRSDAAVKDLVRLTVPPLLILQGLNLAISETVGMLLNPLSVFASDVVVTASSEASNVSGDPITGIALLLANALFLSLGYVSVALPATRVILRERDDQLVTGIQAACRLAAERKTRGGSSGTPARVVAVLGLLHVNGVAQRLIANNAVCAEKEKLTDASGAM